MSNFLPPSVSPSNVSGMTSSLFNHLYWSDLTQIRLFPMLFPMFLMRRSSPSLAGLGSHQSASGMEVAPRWPRRTWLSRADSRWEPAAGSMKLIRTPLQWPPGYGRGYNCNSHLWCWHRSWSCFICWPILSLDMKRLIHIGTICPLTRAEKYYINSVDVRIYVP